MVGAGTIWTGCPAKPLSWKAAAAVRAAFDAPHAGAKAREEDQKDARAQEAAVTQLQAGEPLPPGLG